MALVFNFYTLILRYYIEYFNFHNHWDLKVIEDPSQEAFSIL